MITVKVIYLFALFTSLIGVIVVNKTSYDDYPVWVANSILLITSLSLIISVSLLIGCIAGFR